MTDPSVGDRTHNLPHDPIDVPATDHSTVAGVTAQLVRVSGLVGSALGKIGARLERQDPLHHSERKRIIRSLFHEGKRLRPFFIRFTSLMALAVTIAALGILSDSTAVVIGAMLVAPLMGPVLGIAAGVVMAWPLRIVRQSAMVATGAALSVGLAAAISFAIPGNAFPLPAELLARTSPNLLDLGIALAAGAAGAYGQVRRQASDALPGVAVAVALVPPLAVVGITLQLMEWQYALGAFLLFLVNVAGIVISASLTFIAAGFVPGHRLLTGNYSIATGLRWVAVAVIIVVLPLQFGRGNVLPATDQTAEIVAAVEEFVAADSTTAEVVDVSIEVEEGVTDVNVVLVAPQNSTPRVLGMARYLAKELKTSVAVSLQILTTQTNRATITSP